MVTIKNEKDIIALRVSGKILASVLRALKESTIEGVATIELDKKARMLIQNAGAIPAFLGYAPDEGSKPFPAAICASLNDVIVHGVPSKKPLKKGDILGIDLGVNYRGYFTDAAITIEIGEISQTARKLIQATEEALRRAIKACKRGNHLGDVGYEISETAKYYGFKIVKGLTGHGVGFAIHEDPTIYNQGKRGEGIILKSGYVLALEPMFSTGSGEITKNKDESFATRDGSLSAHAEHTILITDGEPEILTL